MSVQIQILRAELIVGGEVLGDGILTGVEVVHGEYSSSLEVPISRAALEHLAAQETGDQVDLALRLSGWLRARNDNEDSQRFASSPEPGAWTFVCFGFGRLTELRFQVARSNWYSQVLQPIGTAEYVSVEIAIPGWRSDAETGR
jgi:hypothetical protein